MKTKLLLILLGIAITSTIVSQTTDYIIIEIQKDFDEYTPEAGHDLVPFQDKKTGKYGYMDAISKKIVIKAKYESLNLPNPEIAGKYKNVEFIGEKINGKIFVSRDKSYGLDIAELIERKPIAIEQRSTKDLNKGFTIDTKPDGRIGIGLYSDIYLYVDDPFLYKGKYYAVAFKNIEQDSEYERTCPMYGIIDSEGNKLADFDFKYKYVQLNKLAKDEIDKYFFVITEYGKELFISTSGKQILIKESKGRKLPCFEELDISIFNHKFGYQIYENGLFDLVNMEWTIKPTEEIKLKFINYSSTRTIYNTHDVDARNDAKIYIRAEETDNHYGFYIDLEGYRYIP